jgi:hypothetical protein
MATTLVTVAQARQHLKLDADMLAAELEDITLKLASATASILTYLDREENEWDTATDPTADLEYAIVVAAILETLGDYYRFRGDDADLRLENVEAGAWLKPNIRRKLHSLRRPSLA